MSERSDFSKFELQVANLSNLRLFANKYVCSIIDLLTRFCWKLIYMYVLWWCMSKRIDFSKLLLVVANLCNLCFYASKFVRTVLTDLLTRFCRKLIYMYVLRWCMSERVDFLKITIGSCKFMQLAIRVDFLKIIICSCKFMQLDIFLQICMCARFWLIY